ncbi:alpha/beta hydrolase [Variovorax sp. CY25R-8]|uniref:alpha/beta hydrolase n=1 Tax=Variovorax sp. CY25R-8 TaxID=2855501 RepID=UPI0021BB688A|nr:alpha/beta hydrolase [Variovorax sp. CY25R-8]MCT8174466.1 alpha/beta hydrolase [Variovorax sp. CY25R-8]
MTASKILAAVAVALLAATGAQAETYDGVHTVHSTVSRSEVASQAVAAARAGDAYSEGATAGAQPFSSTADRSAVRAEAVAKAHDPLQSLDRRAFYRDEVPQAYKKPSVSFTRQAGL